MTTDDLDQLEAEFVDVIARLDAQTGGNPTALFRERVVIDYELRSVARRALAAAREPLDAAWREAEAALPEGWRLALARTEDDFDLWEAVAVSVAFFEGENDDDDNHQFGSGPTPAAALLALAAALRKPVTA